MFFKNILFFTLVTISIILVGCGRDVSYNPMRTELDNGMVILSQKYDNLPIVAISIWAKVGSAYEKNGEYGISHFLEHMLFRRTPTLEEQVSIQAEIEGSGGYLNGATGKEITYYFAVVPKDFAQKALHLLLDLFLNPNFSETDFIEEKKVIIEEISRKYDNPTDLIYDLIFETVYIDHPYGHCVLGDIETIKDMKLDSLFDYYKSYYHPSNMVISLVGDFNQEIIMKELKGRFGNSQDKISNLTPGLSEIKKGIRRETIKKDVNQIYFILGFTGPSVEDDEHLSLDLLATILGEGASSRLVEHLREREKLVNAISSHFFTQKLSGLFTIFAQFDPQNLEKTEKIIWEEIERIKSEPIGNAELEKAKRMVEAHFYFQHEVFKDQALAHGYWECLGVPDYEKRYLDQIKKITSEDIKKVALKYLDSRNFSQVIIKPAS